MTVFRKTEDDTMYDPNFEDNKQFVADNLPIDILIEQYVEELAELQQVCMKYVRKLRKINPTPVSITDIQKSIIAEMADVELCADLIKKEFNDSIRFMSDNVDIDILSIKQTKANRWVQRIQDKKLYETSVRDLDGLRTRDINALYRHGIDTVKDVVSEWYDHKLMVRNLGDTGRENVKNALEKLGIILED